MRDALIHAVTNLGDSAVTGALAISLTLYLIKFQEKKAAFTIAAAYILTASLIVLGKVVLYSQCQPFALPFDLRSPSGHSGLSLTVYGLMTAMIASTQKDWRRIALYAGAILLVAAIAVSRVVLAYHSRSDVGVGLLIGGGVSVGLWWRVMRGHIVACRWQPFFLMALVLLILLYGIPMPAETLISRISDYIRASVHRC